MLVDRRGVQAVLVALLALFWAVNWPAMKIGLTVVEPWTFRALLVTVGGFGCLVWALALREKITFPKADLGPILLLSLVQGVFWNAFSGFGISLTEAGRAAVLAFTMPIWATLLAMIVLKEPVTPRRVGGLALGTAALGVLLLPEVGGLADYYLGSALMIAGAMAWAVSTIIIKATSWHSSPLAVSGWHFVFAAPVLWGLAITIGDPATLGNVDAATGAVIAYSAIVPMIFCQVMWFLIVRRLPTSLASMATLLVPPFGVFAAHVVLGETVGWHEFAAVVLVVVALLFILPGFNVPALRRSNAADRRNIQDGTGKEAAEL